MYLKLVKMVNFLLHIFNHSKNKVKKIQEDSTARYRNVEANDHTLQEAADWALRLTNSCIQMWTYTHINATQAPEHKYPEKHRSLYLLARMNLQTHNLHSVYTDGWLKPPSGFKHLLMAEMTPVHYVM